MEYDLLIVGGGPAGLSAAIKFKQLCNEKQKDLKVCVVDKGAELGAHILSGNVFEPKALNELVPDWKAKGAPLETEVTDDHFFILPNKTSSFEIPHALLPSQLNNDGNYIISLGKLVRWLGDQAGELGVDVFPGFAASEVLYGDKGEVVGIATGDMGIGKDNKPKSSFTRGMELRAKQTLFAEGCRGSCTESIIKRFDLRKNSQMQTYGLGLKEVWEVPEDKCHPGRVQHTLGFPLQSSLLDKTFGGSFLYHMKPNLLLVGFVVGLDYENPYLSPYQEFQQWKHHSLIAAQLEGGKCIAYGARVLNEGGYHAIPKLTFPGGALIGCSAGFLNSIKIKGSHTAMKSGMLAAEAVFQILSPSLSPSPASSSSEITDAPYGIEPTQYATLMEKSWVYDELKEIRNTHQSFAAGVLPGLLYSGFATMITKGKEPWTIPHTGRDCDRTKKASECTPIEYPKPDGKLSFDLLTNLSRSGTNHADQPSHLKVKPELASTPLEVSLPLYAGPEQRFCPAKVYEYIDNKLVINNQNCVHCKCCAIKTPNEVFTLLSLPFLFSHFRFFDFIVY
jgi:electron-transferring-flavoprotein dehydrogenase